MVCGVCGADIREGAKFCSECGSPTTLACPNCKSPISPTDRFCAECGTPLSGAAGDAATAPSAPVPVEPAAEERRFVSALFVDIVGFTPLAEARDSEEVRHMLTVYFERAREIVARFGGVIDKYIGDALMAVWGARVGHEDDAERAVRAGLEVIEAVADLGDELGLPDLQARAGVLSGEAAVGADGNAVTGLIIGDTVNVASRLQSAAAPGTVLVGRSTRDLAGQAIEFEAVGPLELKGKAEPVEAWRAVRVVGGRSGTRRGDGMVPPFVGRADELRLLKDTLHTVERESRIRLVSVVGQAGIGKSRLVDELWNYADGLTETVFWHRGRSPAYGDGLSFWALGEMVRQRCGSAESDDVHRTRTRLRTMIAEYVPDADDRAWMEPRLEGLLGLAEMPSGDRAELFAAWRTLFHRIAEDGPVVMVFEDLHWADDGTLDFIEEMLSVGTEVPILVITLARPEILDRRRGWGSGRANCISLHLAPLAPVTMGDLVTGLVVNAPPTLVDRLVERAGGVPLYAVELLRMLLTHNLIEPAGEGRYRMSGDVTDVEIPDSLHELVGARLDQLEPEARALIADAAVLGQSFTLDGLGTLRRESAEELTAALQPLVQREILSVERDPRSPERGQYHFVQSIIREVAHQRVRKADRLTRHLRVAEYFESLQDPELAGIVASHYLDALESATPGDEQERLRGRVIAALISAADRADALRSHSQVVRLCRRGNALTDDPGERGELLLRAARAAHAGLDSDAETLAREAFAAFTEAGDGLGRVRAAEVSAKMLDDFGRSNEAWPELKALLEEAPGETADHAVAMAELGRGLMLDGRSEEALEWCDRALAAAERLDLIPVIAEAWTTKGAGLGILYRLREGIVLLEAALALCREHQLLGTKRRVLTNLAYVESSDNPVLGEERFIEERLEDARRLGNPLLLKEALYFQAENAANRLDWPVFETALAAVDQETLPPDFRAAFRSLTLFRRLISGEPEAAAAAEEELWSGLEPGDAQTEVGRNLQRGIHAYMTERFEEAFDRFIEVDHPAPAQSDASWALVTALHLRDPERLTRVEELIDSRPFRGRNVDLMHAAAEAGLAALAGRHAEAAGLFERAAELADEIWGPLYGNLVRAEAARYLGLDDAQGRAYAREAYDTYAAGGATTLLGLLSEGLLSPEAEARSAEA